MSRKHSFIGSVLLSLLALCAGVGHASPIGPDPTLEAIQTDGPFAIVSQRVTGPGFGGGTVFTPTQPGQYALVAISPGFTGAQSSVWPLAQRLATHGFVVVAITTNSPFDFPSSRATQLLAALKTVSRLTTGPAAGQVDVQRQAVAGYSMGGGGALEAAGTTPKLSAVVAFAPWHDTARSMRANRVPAAIIGGSADTVAPVREHSLVFYKAIPQTTPKLLAVIGGATHDFPTTASEPASYTHISWMKRFADGDTRYSDFLNGDDPALSNFGSNGPF